MDYTYLLNILGNPKILASPTGEEGQFGETYPKSLRGYDYTTLDMGDIRRNPKEPYYKHRRA
jgi:hypothetical protein